MFAFRGNMRVKGDRLCPLVPGEGRIIVRRIIEPKKEGGLILPEQNKNEPYLAKILAVTGWIYTRRDCVIVPCYAGVKINYIDGNEYIILKEDEILCKIRR